MTAGSSGRGELKVRVKTAKGRKLSSQRWLERQLNDPYVREAKTKGYRSRAAFKLIELDRKFHLLKKGGRVLDLGAAPGGWTQVAVARVGDTGRVGAADILAMEPLAGAEVLQADLLAPETPARLVAALDGKASLVLSDMAAPTTGHRATDHLRTVALLEAALDVAQTVLAPGGAFIGKVFQGGATGALLARFKQQFRDVKHVKPPASRAESVELYLVATGFRGAPLPSADAGASADTFPHKGGKEDVKA
jgi:23S rRNA (uridine2552-2'-O)-methyltransferase